MQTYNQSYNCSDAQLEVNDCNSIIHGFDEFITLSYSTTIAKLLQIPEGAKFEMLQQSALSLQYIYLPADKGRK